MFTQTTYKYTLSNKLISSVFLSLLTSDLKPPNLWVWWWHCPYIGHLCIIWAVLELRGRCYLLWPLCTLIDGIVAVSRKDLLFFVPQDWEDPRCSRHVKNSLWRPCLNMEIFSSMIDFAQGNPDCLTVLVRSWIRLRPPLCSWPGSVVTS